MSRTVSSRRDPIRIFFDCCCRVAISQAGPSRQFLLTADSEPAFAAGIDWQTRKPHT